MDILLNKKKRKEDSNLSNHKILVPEAREALNQFKMEVAKELGISSPNPIENGYLSSYHTGYFTKKLVEMAEKQLINNNH